MYIKSYTSYCMSHHNIFVTKCSKTSIVRGYFALAISMAGLIQCIRRPVTSRDQTSKPWIASGARRWQSASITSTIMCSNSPDCNGNMNTLTSSHHSSTDKQILKAMFNIKCTYCAKLNTRHEKQQITQSVGEQVLHKAQTKAPQCTFCIINKVYGLLQWNQQTDDVTALMAADCLLDLLAHRFLCFSSIFLSFSYS